MVLSSLSPSTLLSLKNSSPSPDVNVCNSSSSRSTTSNSNDDCDSDNSSCSCDTADLENELNQDLMYMMDNCIMQDTDIYGQENTKIDIITQDYPGSSCLRSSTSTITSQHSSEEESMNSNFRLRSRSPCSASFITFNESRSDSTSELSSSLNLSTYLKEIELDAIKQNNILKKQISEKRKLRMDRELKILEIQSRKKQEKAEFYISQFQSIIRKRFQKKQKQIKVLKWFLVFVGFHIFRDKTTMALKRRNTHIMNFIQLIWKHHCLTTCSFAFYRWKNLIENKLTHDQCNDSDTARISSTYDSRQKDHHITKEESVAVIKVVDNDDTNKTRSIDNESGITTTTNNSIKATMVEKKNQYQTKATAQAQDTRYACLEFLFNLKNKMLMRQSFHSWNQFCILDRQIELDENVKSLLQKHRIQIHDNGDNNYDYKVIKKKEQSDNMISQQIHRMLYSKNMDAQETTTHHHHHQKPKQQYQTSLSKTTTQFNQYANSFKYIQEQFDRSKNSNKKRKNSMQELMSLKSTRVPIVTPKESDTPITVSSSVEEENLMITNIESNNTISTNNNISIDSNNSNNDESTMSKIDMNVENISNPIPLLEQLCKSLPKEKLLHLSMNVNQIQSLQNFSILLQLQRLDLNFNQIKNLEGLDFLKELKELNLESNCVDSLYPIGFPLQVDSAFLSSESCDYVALPLQKLNLKGNRIKSLKANTNNNVYKDSKTYNDISSKKLILSLPNLISLSLHQNHITHISCHDFRNLFGGFEGSKKLVNLDLGRNLLNDHHSIGKVLSTTCPTLMELILSENNFKEIPILQLPILQKLFLSGNHIESIFHYGKEANEEESLEISSSCSCWLPSLKELHLNDNYIELSTTMKITPTHQPTSCFVDMQPFSFFCPNLELLDLSFNEIGKEDEDSIEKIDIDGRFNHNISKNKSLMILGTMIEHLNYLQYLKISDNPIMLTFTSSSTSFNSSLKHFMISKVPSLKKFNGELIKDEERWISLAISSKDRGIFIIPKIQQHNIKYHLDEENINIIHREVKDHNRSRKQCNFILQDITNTTKDKISSLWNDQFRQSHCPRCKCILRKNSLHVNNHTTTTFGRQEKCPSCSYIFLPLPQKHHPLLLDWTRFFDSKKKVSSFTDDDDDDDGCCNMKVNPTITTCSSILYSCSSQQNKQAIILQQQKQLHRHLTMCRYLREKNPSETYLVSLSSSSSKNEKDLEENDALVYLNQVLSCDISSPLSSSFVEKTTRCSNTGKSPLVLHWTTNRLKIRTNKENSECTRIRKKQLMTSITPPLLTMKRKEKEEKEKAALKLQAFWRFHILSLSADSDTSSHQYHRLVNVNAMDTFSQTNNLTTMEDSTHHNESSKMTRIESRKNHVHCLEDVASTYSSSSESSVSSIIDEEMKEMFREEDNFNILFRDETILLDNDDVDIRYLKTERDLVSSSHHYTHKTTQQQQRRTTKINDEYNNAIPTTPALRITPNNVPPLPHSTSGSNKSSQKKKKKNLLGIQKKHDDIMKEWGITDPNLLNIMMKRKKHMSHKRRKKKSWNMHQGLR